MWLFAPVTAGSSAVRVAPIFTWRSGEEVSEVGHIRAESMGQTIPTSEIVIWSAAREISGMTHIAPIT
jgi:hypothetical protein